jgi:hypothetical protein
VEYEAEYKQLNTFYVLSVFKLHIGLFLFTWIYIEIGRQLLLLILKIQQS